MIKNVKISKEKYGHPDSVFGQRPDDHTYLSKLGQIWGFCKACSGLYDNMDQQLLIP